MLAQGLGVGGGKLSYTVQFLRSPYNDAGKQTLDFKDSDTPESQSRSLGPGAIPGVLH